MTLYATTTALLILVAISQTSAQVRYRRGSVGSYAGSINGQNYGGTFHKPDNGPAVYNRFGGDESPQSGHPGSSSGSFAGASSGSHGDSSGYAPQFPFVNLPPFQGPTDFNNFFQNYFKLLNDNLATASRQNKPHSMTSSTVSVNFLDKPGEGAFSKNFAYQQAAFEAAQNAFQSTANKYEPNGSNFNGAASSAHYGPGGGHQTAGTYPENHSNPNINTRFQSEGPQPGGGSFGVSSASFASSSDVNGHKTNRKEAVTTINDNGKVTTYRVKN